MNKSPSLLWFFIIIIFLLPTSLGRIFIDMASGIFILTLILVLLISGVSWLTWKNIKSKIKTCNDCGSSYLSDLNQCPICGSQNTLNNEESNINIPASSATIDIEVKESD